MGFTGFAVLPCRFHSDASVASRGSGALVDALETLGAFERGNVSGLCRMGGKSARLCSEVSPGYTRIHGGRIWLGAAEPDRKSVVEGKGVSVRVDLGGRRMIQKKKRNKKKQMKTSIS